MKAYIFIQVAPGKKESIIEEIKKDDKIKEVHSLMGEYDGVVIVECKLRELQKILDRIRKLNFIEKTNTMIGWERNINE